MIDVIVPMKAVKTAAATGQACVRWNTVVASSVMPSSATSTSGTRLTVSACQADCVVSLDVTERVPT